MAVSNFKVLVRSGFILLSLWLCLAVPSLFAASITNEGKTSVKISGKTKNGILGSVTIQPGQTLPLRKPFLWIEHVMEGSEGEVLLKILENDGTTGRIMTPGGRYTFRVPKEKSQADLDEEKPGKPLQAGYAKNNSNMEIFLTLVKPDGKVLNRRIMHGQTVAIPEDTVEIKIESLGGNRGNEEVSLVVVMPDGVQHNVRSSKTTIRTSVS